MNRHEGTKARRHGGAAGAVELSVRLYCSEVVDGVLERNGTVDGNDSHTPRPDRVAEGHDVVEGPVCRDTPDAGFGTVRIDEPDATGGRVGALEHRGRLRIGKSTRVPETPADRPRIAGGVVDAMGAGYGLDDAPPRPAGVVSSRRNRPRAPGTDPSRAAVETAQKGLAAPDAPPCLRASVPSCL